MILDPSQIKPDLDANNSMTFTSWGQEASFVRVFKVELTDLQLATYKAGGFYPTEVISLDVKNAVLAYCYNTVGIYITEFKTWFQDRQLPTALNGENARVNTIPQTINVVRSNEKTYIATVQFGPCQDIPWRWNYIHDFNVKIDNVNQQYIDKDDESAGKEKIVVRYKPRRVTNSEYARDIAFYERSEVAPIYKPYKTLRVSIVKTGYDTYEEDRTKSWIIGHCNTEHQGIVERTWLCGPVTIRPLTHLPVLDSPNTGSNPNRATFIDEAKAAFKYQWNLEFWYNPEGWDPLLFYKDQYGKAPYNIDTTNLLAPNHSAREGAEPYGALRPYVYPLVNFWVLLDPLMDYREFKE